MNKDIASRGMIARLIAKTFRLDQRSGTFLAERAIIAAYFKMHFHERHKIFSTVINNVLILAEIHVLSHYLDA